MNQNPKLREHARKAFTSYVAQLDELALAVAKQREAAVKIFNALGKGEAVDRLPCIGTYEYSKVERQAARCDALHMALFTVEHEDVEP
jgi:hypothetical protein